MKAPTQKFKPCPACPNPKKCGAMGSCMKKASKK
jgi:hypothetical protein